MLSRVEPILLEDYSISELVQIGKVHAKRMDINQINENAYVKLAVASRGVPRIIVKTLALCSDIAGNRGIEIDEKIVKEALELKGITEQGLTVNDMKILAALSNADDGLSLRALAGITGENVDTIEMIEKFLLKEGLITISSRRFITVAGKSIIQAQQSF